MDGAADYTETDVRQALANEGIEATVAIQRSKGRRLKGKRVPLEKLYAISEALTAGYLWRDIVKLTKASHTTVSKVAKLLDAANKMGADLEFDQFGHGMAVSDNGVTPLEGA